MTTSIAISLLGALSAILVSIMGAWLTNRNSLALQTRKLKEEHYISYVEAVHNLGEDIVSDKVERYVFARDKMFLVASEDVIRKMIAYEEQGVGKGAILHDKYLTDLIKSIRKDLLIKDKDFPSIYLKKSTPDKLDRYA